jgi:hypothetical protein
MYFTVTWYNLWPFGIFCSHFGIFSPFWYIVPGKSGKPGLWFYINLEFEGLAPAVIHTYI